MKRDTGKSDQYYVIEENCSNDHILHKLASIKSHITKLIFNLFNFMNLSPNLEFSDQVLLKSLLTINLFLHHCKLPENNMQIKLKNDEFKIFLKLLVVQMTNLIDRFRCKHCFILK